MAITMSFTIPSWQRELAKEREDSLANASNEMRLMSNEDSFYCHSFVCHQLCLSLRNHNCNIMDKWAIEATTLDMECVLHFFKLSFRNDLSGIGKPKKHCKKDRYSFLKQFFEIWNILLEYFWTHAYISLRWSPAGQIYTSNIALNIFSIIVYPKKVSSREEPLANAIAYYDDHVFICCLSHLRHTRIHLMHSQVKRPVP